MQQYKNYSENPRINILIESILDELCPFLEEQAKDISDLTAIGKALGTGKDVSALLEMILSIARRFTNADGGTLYLVDSETRSLKFHVLHNDSLKIKKSGKAIDLPDINLYQKNNSQNLSHVSSYVLHTGRIVNIKDVYHTSQFNFDGSKIFDKALNYKSQSMLVIPMKNHENDIIGILQLINSMDPSSKKIIPFNKDVQEKADALANQASVILTQQMLIVEMKALFEAFIKAIAISIDEKSKQTGSHIQRVTELCMMIARKINADQTHFKDIQLTDDQIDELRIAALMHDTGKITTPDHIINKSSKLETVFDRFELIKTRWELFKTKQKLKAAEKKLALIDNDHHSEELSKIDTKCMENLDILDKELAQLYQINTCKTRLDNHQITMLKAIYEKSDLIDAKPFPYLTPDEFENLNIQQGTLTQKERKTINHHANLSEKILSKLPWPKKLSKIPSIAGAHHEKLDGSGYPSKLNRKDLNLQARILAISDIFEALSAQDRPYKDPMPLSKTKSILKHMGNIGHLDKNVISLLFSTQTHLEYAKKHLSEPQIDL